MAVRDLRKGGQMAIAKDATLHRDTVESSLQDMAAFLQEVLGQKLVAYTIGVGDSKTVGRWATGARTPRESNETRLRETYYVFRLLNAVESSYTVRAWFAGMNPLLGDEAPSTAIREGRAAEVVSAARAFVAHG